MRRGEDTQRHRIEGDVKMGAEFGVMHLQAKEAKDCLEPLAFGRGKEDSSARAFKGNMALLTP